MHLMACLSAKKNLRRMSDSEKHHICQECGQTFDTIESLKEHQQVERQEKILRSEEIED
jgi:hypothetical protein